MVATTDCAEKAKQTAGIKVSKPLMEKKRRARINRCLDELKSLLENFYSSSIRKRKLEKADILELTVNHLKNLQKIQNCTSAASEYPDYQIGFSSCLANVHQYLQMANNLNGSDRWMLLQLSNKLSSSRRRGLVCSTMDSGLNQTEAQHETRKLLLSARGSEEDRTVKLEAQSLPDTSTTQIISTEDPSKSRDGKQVVVSVQKTSDGGNSSHRNSDCVRHEAANTELSVWRPW